MLDAGFSIVVAMAAVFVTVAVVAALLPVGGVVGVAVSFLTLTGAMSGYAGWRWVRWVKVRAERMHWSVVAAAGAAITSAELYAASGLATHDTGFLERLSGVAGLGLLASVTVAVTAVVSMVIHQRAVTDEQLIRLAERRRAWIAGPALIRAV